MNMKKYIYKFLIILIITVSFLPLFTVSADEINSKNTAIVENENLKIKTQIPDITINSKAAILIDSSTGQILFESNAHERLYPASTTKLLTAILTLENCNLSDVVTVDANALNGIPRSYTTAGLKANEQLTVEQLLHVLLIPSANDAANVLAFHIAGSIENFSVMMNSKAKEIGCLDSNFLNPSGIHNDEHYSTAYDMALIGKFTNKFDTIKQIATITNYSLPNSPDGKERNFKTTNLLITPKNKYFYEYATGLKTGYTDKAKSCIVAKAEKDDVELICVVLGGAKTENGENQREIDCKNLFDYGFNNYKYHSFCEKDSLIDSNMYDLPEKFENHAIAYSDDLKILAVENNLDSNSSEIVWNDNIDLPIYKDTVVGTINYNIDNKSYSVDLVADEDILPNDSSVNYIFYILIIIFILILFFIIFKGKFNKKSLNKNNRTGKKHRILKSKEPKYFKHSFY